MLIVVFGLLMVGDSVCEVILEKMMRLNCGLLLKVCCGLIVKVVCMCFSFLFEMVLICRKVMVLCLIINELGIFGMYILFFSFLVRVCRVGILICLI